MRLTVLAACPAIARLKLRDCRRVRPARSPRAHLRLTVLSAQDLQALQEPQELEEVVVTAGFRDRDLMTSPGSVTVVDAETARDRAAQHLESVLNAAPNISYSSGGSRARFIQVRGIGDLEQFLDPKHFPSLDNTRTTFADEPGRDDQQSTALAGRAEWLIGEAATLGAVVTWLDSDLAYGFDEDWTFDGICDGLACEPYSGTDEYLRDRSEVSFDLRLLGEARPGAAASIEYVAGVYAQRRDEDLHRLYYGDFFSAYETDREALYGQIDIAPGSKLSLTAGFRYERFSDGYDDTGGFSSASDDTLKSGELTLAFDASPDTTLYATVSRGNKAGGVNTAASANFPFMQPRFQAFMHGRLLVGKETLLNTEVGLKGRYLDGRLALRASLFDMDRDNAQLESWMWDAASFLWIGFLDNVDGSNKGAELELEFDASARARLFASIGWLDTDIERIETYDLDLGDFVVRTGIDQAKSPELQFNLGASIRFSDRWRARVELEGRDDSRFGYYHERTLPSHTLLNASVRASFGSTELQLWGRNLADRDYAVHGLYFGNDPRKGWINESYFQYGEPRVVGVTVRHSF